MPGVSETRTYDSLLSTTLANYRDKLIDNIFDVYPLLSYLNGKLQKVISKKVKRVLEGGESIVEHLLYEKSTAVKSYSGAETLDTSLQEGITIARFSWKQYAASIGITGLEKRANQGESAMIDLLEAKTKQAEMSLRDTLSIDAFGNGTGNSSKVLTGLAAIVSTTTTLGGLSPTTYSWWQGKVKTSAGSFAANGIKEMRIKFNDVSYGNDKPDLILTDQATHEYYEASLQPQERFTNNKVADAGFTNLEFKGIPVLFDRDCTAGYMYFLNSDYINFVVHKDADFETGKFITPENQDVSTAMILFQGNITTNNRRMLGVIQGFTA